MDFLQQKTMLSSDGSSENDWYWRTRQAVINKVLELPSTIALLLEDINVKCILLCAIACFVSLVIDYLNVSLLLYAVFKTTSALCFVIIAANNLKNVEDQTATAGVIIVVGQTFSLVGDILLVGSQVHDIFFLTGGFSFAFAHVCYMAAYIHLIASRTKHGVQWWCMVLMSVWASVITYACIINYILPEVPSSPGIMKSFTVGYSVVISIMVSLSPGGDGPRHHLACMHCKPVLKSAIASCTHTIERVINKKFVYRTAGSLLFYMSDICVARQKFIADEFINRAIGLPLYFVAQVLIACSI